MEKITFIWCINGKSDWCNNEVKFSIGSVKKFHPNAEIIILGERPDFYNGKFVEHKDVDASPYINKWKKILHACQLEDIPDQFVIMDDDFFLLEPLQKKHFSNSNTFWEKVEENKGKNSHWISALRNTKALVHEDTKNYCIHAPLWIDKKSFLEFSTKFNLDIPPGLVLRQIYINYLNGSIFPIEELEKDIKIRVPYDIKNCKYFFSTYNDLVQSGFHHVLKNLYPDVLSTE